MNILLNLNEFWSDFDSIINSSDFSFFRESLAFLGKILLIIFFIIFIIWLIYIIGLIGLAKRNNVSSPIVKAIFIPTYLMGELVFETYSKDKVTYMKWVLLCCTLSCSFLPSRLFGIVSLGLLIFNYYFYIKILDYGKNTRAGTVILTLLGFGPLLLLINRNRIPLGLDNNVNTNINLANSDQEFKYCVHCGNQIPKEAKFCSSCGTNQEK